MSKIINFIKTKDFTAIAIALVVFCVWFYFASSFEPWTVLITFILGCYYVGQLTMKADP